ncbi:transcriptional regulator [Streptomyces sp. NPDC002516]
MLRRKQLARSKTVTALEKAGHVSVRKGYFGKRSRTWLALTRSDRTALAAHLAALEAPAPAADVRTGPACSVTAKTCRLSRGPGRPVHGGPFPGWTR